VSDPKERVKIWNTFFKLARKEAESLHEASTGKESSKIDHFLGGTLPDEEFHAFATLVLCNLAIEARANHLIDELEEKGKITEDVAQAARWLRNTEHKWFLLPKLAGKRKRLDSSKGPHQAIRQICDLRNTLLHVNYPRLKRKLPKPDTTLSYFSRFVEAVEDMNVVLGRTKKARKKVLNIGRFT